MKVHRILLPLAVLLLFVGSAPAAAGPAFGAASSAAERSSTSRLDRSSPRESAPKLVAVSVGHRSALVARGAGRRFTGGSSKLRALGTVAGLVGGAERATRVDDDADARLLETANTPCAARGPPAAA